MGFESDQEIKYAKRSRQDGAQLANAKARPPIGGKPSLTPLLLCLITAAAGLTVANNYYNQALLGMWSTDFQVSAATVALVPVLTQLGNVTGIVLLAPMGDRIERRSLILCTMAVLIGALILSAVATDFVWLAMAGMCVGLFATVTQQLVPFAMHLAPPNQSGRVLGMVTGGILVGILLARAVSGIIAEFWGWNAVFWIAAFAMTVTLVVLAVNLPRVEASTSMSYGQLITSLWTLLRKHRVLRHVIAVQGLIFASFMSFWSTLSIALADAPFRLGAAATGLIALTGVSGALAAPLVGRLADRYSPRTISGIATCMVIASFLIFGAIQGSLLAIGIGVFVLDVAVQSSQVANQTTIYSLDTAARSRLNTIFMATMIVGGSCGSGLGGLAYSISGWTGVCTLGACLASLAVLLQFMKGDPGAAQ